MDENKYKKLHKPAACGRAPWASIIESHKRDQVMRQIRLECLQIYGYEMDTCPKRGVCLGKDCLSRPLPWKSPTAKPYLEKMQKLGMLQNNEYYVTPCGGCPIRSSCSSPCAQINDFLNRHQSQQPELIYQEDLSNYVQEPLLKAPESPVMASIMKGLVIPWDCINSAQEAIIRLRLYKRRDFLTIAKKCNLYDQAAAKYEFYAALTKLSEYAVMRQFLKENEKNLTLAQKDVIVKRYIENKNLDIIANENNTTKQNISSIIKRIKNKYKINYSIYVRKRNNKVIYNIPEVLN